MKFHFNAKLNIEIINLRIWNNVWQCLQKDIHEPVDQKTLKILNIEKIIKEIPFNRNENSERIFI